jgi:hypothetical protein
MENEFAFLQSITTPKQLAKFFVWIERNPACMLLLNRLLKHAIVAKDKDIKGEEESGKSI